MMIFTLNFLCKKKNPVFQRGFFAGGEGDDPFKSRLPGGDRLFLGYFYSLFSVSVFPRAVERVDSLYCTYHAGTAIII